MASASPQGHERFNGRCWPNADAGDGPESTLTRRPVVLIADVGYPLPKYNYDVH